MSSAKKQQTQSSKRRRPWGLVGILGGVLGLGVLGVGGLIALCPTCIGWLPSSSAVAPVQGENPGAKSSPTPVGTDAGNQAPDFTLTDIDGNTMALSDLRGRPVVLYFSAAWCLPCVPETRELAQHKARYPNIEIVWISVDPNSDSPESLREHRRKYAREDFIYALDTLSLAVAKQYRVIALGDLYLLDSQGRIAFKGTRPVGSKPFEAALKKLAEP